MKIISLMDDVCSSENLKYEHGFSLYLEIDGQKYLVDTGQSSKFIFNAKKLGVDIADIDAVFISHNHYDHTDGLPAFFKENRKAKVYIKNDAKFDFYATPVMKVSMKSGIYRNNRHRFFTIDKDYHLGNIHLLTDTVGDPEFFCQDKRLLMKKGKSFYPDEFNHELFIAIEMKDKVHVISPCSHRGIVNILKTVKNTFNKEIGMVYAGLHMSASGGKKMNCKPEYFDNVCDELNCIGFEMLYTCHCTGLCAYDALKDRFKERVAYAETGFELKIQ